MMKRRLFKTVIVFLLLGAIVSVAVAWGLWVLEIRPSGPFSGRFPSAADVKWWQDHAPTTFVSQPTQLVVINSFGHYTRTLDVQTGPNTRQIAYRMAAGWPMRTFAGVVWTDLATRIGRPVETGILRPRWNESLRSEGIPNGVVWPGFAINTIFYAAVLWGGWLLSAFPFVVRRRRRIKRGLCPACAYPIGASHVCTECGKPVTPRSVEPS